MTEAIVGSLFALVLVGLVVRDLARISSVLAFVTAAYAATIATLAYRGTFLATAERLPPVSLIAGQFFMALLVISAFALGAKAWREILVLRFFTWHAIRLPMGTLLVLMASSDRLAPQFGWGAGVGEIVVGIWALLYLLVPTSRSVSSVVLWCTVGLLDILVGMSTALLTFRSPIQQFLYAQRMTEMSSIPMVIIPSFSMAVLTISTVLVFLRRNEILLARLRTS